MSNWLWIALTVAGGLGMIACLWVMYADKKRGFPALTALDKDFKSLDMRPRYSPEEVFACFDGVGGEGQRLLKGLWKLDFAFIGFFWMVMAAISRNVSRWMWIFWVMLIAATLRALFDIVENALLLRICGAYPSERLDAAAKAAGTSTLLKWAMMGIWVAGMFVNLMVSAVQLG